MQIEVGTSVAAGDTVSITVSLATGAASVAGTQNDLVFDNTAVDLASAASCTIEASISDQQAGCDNDPPAGPCKALSRSLVVCGGSPQPEGCPVSATNTLSRFRGIIAATGQPNENTIPNGPLYHCNFTVKDAGNLPSVIRNLQALASTPDSEPIDGVVAIDGGVTFGAHVVIGSPAGGTSLVLSTSEASDFPLAGEIRVGSQIVGYVRSGGAFELDAPLAHAVAAGDVVELIIPPLPASTPTPTRTATPTATATVTPV